jgi:hypothetical protein
MRRYVVHDQYWLSDEPLVVDNVGIKGTQITREDVFRLYLSEAEKATTANDLGVSLLQGRESLMALGIFKDVTFCVRAGERENHANIDVIATEKKRKGEKIVVLNTFHKSYVFAFLFQVWKFCVWSLLNRDSRRSLVSTLRSVMMALLGLLLLQLGIFGAEANSCNHLSELMLRFKVRKSRNMHSTLVCESRFCGPA